MPRRVRRLASATGGLYHLATEQTETISLRRFAAAVNDWLGVPAAGSTFTDWESALVMAAQVMIRDSGAASGHSYPPLLVLDEFSCLERQTPGLPSIIQALYDEIGPGSVSNQAPLRLVLCGSAISVMSGLLSGTRALRGRGMAELRIRPFEYRQARYYWRIENPMAAIEHNALIGGTPGYRDIVMEPDVPADPSMLGDWMVRNVLRPTMPLASEGLRVVHEDPRMRDTAVYASILAAIAAGESSPAKIGGLLGRPTTSLSYQLGMLESAGFIQRHSDLLRERRLVITIADPFVRLHHLVIEPNLAELEAGRASEVWARSQHIVQSAICGPHLETISRLWLARFGATEAGIEVGAVGQSAVACTEHRVNHAIDVLALRPGGKPRTPGARIAFIGEAKFRDRRPGAAELRRLEHIRDLLTVAGHDAGTAILGLFSTAGFTSDLADQAARSGRRILLAALDRLYLS